MLIQKPLHGSHLVGSTFILEPKKDDAMMALSLQKNPVAESFVVGDQDPLIADRDLQDQIIVDTSGLMKH